jgi:hypothetical protein
MGHWDISSLRCGGFLCLGIIKSDGREEILLLGNQKFGYELEI